MGYRTTVILSNDHTSEWENDPSLGRKISAASAAAVGSTGGLAPRADIGYGRVVECTHADEQALVVIDSLGLTPLAYSRWRPNDTVDAMALRVLQDAAAKLGYKLIKSSRK